MTNSFASEVGRLSRHNEQARQMREIGAVGSYLVRSFGALEVIIDNITVEKRSTTGEGFVLNSSTDGVLNQDTVEYSGMIIGNQDDGHIGYQTIGTASFTSWTTKQDITVDQKILTQAKNEIERWLQGLSITQPDAIAYGDGDREYSEDDQELENRLGSFSYDSISTSNKQGTIQLYFKTNEGNSLTIRELGIETNNLLISRSVLDSNVQKTNEEELRIEITYSVNESRPWTEAGANVIRDYILNKSITQPSHLAWGSGTSNISGTETTMENELERKVASGSRDYGAVQSATLGESEPSSQPVDITRVALFNDASSGDMLIYDSYNPINKTSLFALESSIRMRVK